MTALKFTDRDVRERPELIAEAVRYLRWYQGEFEFLVDAKRYEAANGNLPLGTARGVLNCMRVDARYAMVGGELPQPVEHEPAVRRKRKLRVVKDPDDRRDPFPLKTYWNARLYYSAHKGASVVHALRLDAELWCYPKHWDGNTIQVRGGLTGVCSQNFSRATERLAREMPEGKRFCHRCIALIEERGYDWGPTTPPTQGDEVTIENTSNRDPLLHVALAMGEDSTGSYITGMEAQGQKEFVTSSVIPTNAPWEKLEAFGFIKGEPVADDPIFTECTLPEGWSKAGTDHSMWSSIVDERGIERVMVFYKAAFYDRSAHASLASPGYARATDVLYGDDEKPGLPKDWAVLTDDERSDFWNGVDRMTTQIAESPAVYDKYQSRVDHLLALKSTV